MKTTAEKKWHYQEESDAYTHIIRDENNRLVVQLPQGTDGRDEANARLIAAAPEMLMALSAYLDAKPWKLGCEALEIVTELAEAAKSKATGRA